MINIANKLKTINNFYKISHFSLQILLPGLVFVFVRSNFIQLAFSLILLSKWRMLAVKPRFWLVNIQANAIDIIVGLSLVLFMTSTKNIYIQLLWVIGYIIWQTTIKPANTIKLVSAQSFIGQLLGLLAIYLSLASAPLWGLTFTTGVICYFSARHFFNSFDEAHTKLLSYFWAYFGSAIAWITGHWLIYYKMVAQPILILTILGYGLALLYYLDNFKKLNKSIKWQFLGVMIIMLIIVIAFSGWTSRAV